MAAFDRPHISLS